ncbi:MAG: right-handed parallel beta-helix repeat-containing protein [Armatimonadota bacterium]
MSNTTITVGPSQADVVGTTNRAIQIALDACAAQGGGTVIIRPGSYLLKDSVHLRSGVSLVGAGPDTILRKCDGVRSPLLIDADYGQLKVTPADTSGFEEGMGISVLDRRHGDGWYVSVVTITRIEDGTLFISDHLVMDYNSDDGGIVTNAFSPISGIGVEDVRIDGITIEGAKATNDRLNGCRGGGIYLYKARRCTIANCTVRDFNGDGISFQITQDIVVENCECTGCTGLGIHPGTGSARPLVRACRIHHNDGIGLFLCWRVQDGRFEENEIWGNGGAGVSIGHKDTRNLFHRNSVRSNCGPGFHFRPENEKNAGHLCRLVENTIEDNGTAGVLIEGQVRDIEITRNRMASTRPAESAVQRVGILIGEEARRIVHRDNQFAGHLDGDVVQRSGVSPS